MNTPSEDDKPWTISETIAPALEVVSTRLRFILSWNQFIYAEGADDEIRIAFATHDVTLRGAGLSPLLHAITLQQVSTIRELARGELFSAPAGPCIREIEVRKLDAA